MVATSTSSFRQGAAVAVIAGAAVLASFGVAKGQQLTLDSTPKSALAVPRIVDEGNCGAFGNYILAEVTARKGTGTISPEWRRSVSRFLRAGCQANDAQGPIHITTMTDGDKRSLATALLQMGSYNIFGISGVRHCHAPTVPGTCPTATGGLGAPKAGGG